MYRSEGRRIFVRNSQKWVELESEADRELLLPGSWGLREPPRVACSLRDAGTVETCRCEQVLAAHLPRAREDPATPVCP